MLTFRLYHTLHLQYCELLQAVSDGFEISGLYGLSRDKIIFEGNNEKALGFCFETGALEECSPAEKEILSARMHEASEIQPETDLAEVFKFLYTALRRSFGLEPCADNYMLNALCRKLNKRLVRHNGHCFLKTDAVILITTSDNRERISLESLVGKLLEVNRHMTAAYEIYEYYQSGQRERKFCRFVEAEACFKKVLSMEKKGTILYQETCFEMGEVFYFTGRMSEAVECYLNCDPKLLDKGEELFLRLGFCLAERKKPSETVLFYTKCRLNGRYLATHKDKFSEEDVPIEEFEEYVKLCERLGALEWERNFIRHE